jgi:hypothetical protein
MLHAIVQVSAMLAMTLAVAFGTWGLPAYPVGLDGDIILQMIFVRTPVVFLVLTYGYATLGFTTPFFALSLLLSLVAIVVSAFDDDPPVATQGSGETTFGHLRNAPRPVHRPLRSCNMSSGLRAGLRSSFTTWV